VNALSCLYRSIIIIDDVTEQRQLCLRASIDAEAITVNVTRETYSFYARVVQACILMIALVCNRMSRSLTVNYFILFSLFLFTSLPSATSCVYALKVRSNYVKLFIAIR